MSHEASRVYWKQNEQQQQLPGAGCRGGRVQRELLLSPQKYVQSEDPVLILAVWISPVLTKLETEG